MLYTPQPNGFNQRGEGESHVCNQNNFASGFARALICILLPSWLCCLYIVILVIV
jgi:hypothetical protein